MLPCALPGRARWGASGSLNPQAAIAGPNAARGAASSGLGLAHVALKVRFRALGASEPRQVREEAALRIPSQVPRFCLARASDVSTTSGAASKAERATGPSLPPGHESAPSWHACHRPGPTCPGSDPGRVRAGAGRRPSHRLFTTRPERTEALLAREAMDVRAAAAAGPPDMLESHRWRRSTVRTDLRTSTRWSGRSRSCAPSAAR